MKRKIVCLVLVAITLLSTIPAMTVSANTSVISVILDGNRLNFDVPPQIVDGRTMVPLRAIFEAFGASVEWDDSTKTVTSTKDERTIKMSIGQANITVNGENKVLDVAPAIIDNRTLVPVRAVAEGLDAKVEWDDEVKTVSIFTSAIVENTVSLYKPDGTTKEVPTHLSLVYKEHGWYEFPVVTMYDTTGNTIVVGEGEVQTYKNVGWYEFPVVTMYSADGRTIAVGKDEVEAHKNVGWYEFPVVTMYNATGNTIVVGKGEVEAYKNVGWYEFPVVTLYSIDGSTIVVGKGEVDAYKNVGWYISLDEANNAKKMSDPKYAKVREALNDCKRYVSYLYYDGAILETDVDLYRLTKESKYLVKITEGVIDISSYFNKIKGYCADIGELYPLYAVVNYDIPIITSSNTHKANTLADRAMRVKITYNALCDSYGGEKIK